MDSSVKFALTLFGLFIAVMFFIALIPFTMISTGEKGIVLNMGVVNRTIEPGFNFIMPFVEDVVVMDMTTQIESVTASAASKDLQTVTAEIAVNYQLQPEKIVDIYTSYREDVKNRVISPAIQEAVKAATAKYTAEELITKRELARQDMVDALKAKLDGAHINVVDVSIKELNFSQQFNTAIEAKVQAEQEAQKAKNDLQRVQFESEQRVSQAQAEAEAIRIQAQAITQQGGSNYVQLQAIQKWDGHLPEQMVPGSTVPFINLTK